MPGRKRKPTKLKLVQGTDRKDRRNPNEPEPEVGIPEAPAWLLPEAREEWDRVTGELAALGVIAKIDGAVLALYCQLMGQFVQAQKNPARMDSEGEPVIVVNAALIAQIRALAASFGLEPSSRARISGKDKSKSSKWGNLNG